jgi:hypothetical protein
MGSQAAKFTIYQRNEPGFSLLLAGAQVYKKLCNVTGLGHHATPSPE